VLLQACEDWPESLQCAVPAVESDGVTPQSAVQSASSKAIYVVPNPYRGSAQWDLTPNAADPTGTHVDFYNMPDGAWTLRIFTISGDLVQTLRQDGSTAGFVAWDLRTKDNLDVAPGLYVYHVDAPKLGSYIGKFAVIK
jgi:hypothetical protein